ncbi:MAG: hypothetical protein IJS40_07435 [Synergistaceae bacterium]|nr:hypothetical protein [Synergistaceae bacterium]
MTLKKNSATSKKFVVAIFIILFSITPAISQEKINIVVTDMWLAMLTSFIGGSEVQVTPLKVWNSNGDLVIAERGKILRTLSDDSKIIALDEKEAKSVKGLEKFNVRFLYSSFPVDASLVIDPSVIPFVAQRILTALSEWDTPNYSYYQRRLAEFQARLSGAVLVGQVLKDITICDLSGSCGILLQAAGCKIERPEKEILERWHKANFSGLRDYLENQKNKNVITVFDDDTPNALRKYLSGRSDTFHWGRPPEGIDYPTFLNEQYISLWQKIRAKPLK